MKNPYPEVQIRYAAYCLFNGKVPKAMRKHDRDKGGCGLVDFILWIQDGISDYRELCPQAFCGSHLSDQDGFSDYLLNLN